MNPFTQRSTIPGTGLSIPFATVGTMMFGSRADEAESRRIVDTALDRGIDFFDTADSYNAGQSERILGRVLKGRRDGVLVATKVGYAKDEQGREEGISAAAIRRAIDLSLQRLGMDYVDVYYLHRPDAETPVAESLETMAGLVRAGKIRHFAISNYGAWQTYEILDLCDRNGWPLPAMTQMIHNLLLRQIELEYVPLCRHRGLHLTVYNPLAGGLLTGKYTSLHDEQRGSRFVDNEMYRRRYWTERMFSGAQALQRIASAYGMTLTHLALNWIAQQGKVDSILLGPCSQAQLLDCLAAGENPIPADALRDINAFLLEFDGTNACYAR
jgi:aryl-alcohol dehydrogenase-like predicted oxidoreductase